MGVGNLALSVLARTLDRRKKPEPLPTHPNKKRTLLNCHTIRGSVAAVSCLQMLMRSKGVKLSRETAMERLGISTEEEENLPTPRKVQQIVSKYYTRWRLKKIKFPEREIDKGNLVMAVATKEKPQDHIVIIKGYNKDYFWVVNPLYKNSHKSKKSQVHFEALGEYYALTKN